MQRSLRMRESEELESFLEYFDYLLLQLPNEKTGKKEIFSDFEQRPISLVRANLVFENWITDHGINITLKKLEEEHILKICSIILQKISKQESIPKL